jgi:8-oxo-dGTP pyrophosphatase MutT (NUDIX family)
MKREFTTSVYLIENQQVLLIYHPKLHKWLPPGGHIEENETPSEAAIREVKEETNLAFEFIMQRNLLIDRWNAKSIECPFLCLLEEIPAYKEIPAHQHVDLIFIGKPIEGSLQSPFNAKWFFLNELEQLQPDEEIFVETLNVIKYLFALLNPILYEETLTINHSSKE